MALSHGFDLVKAAEALLEDAQRLAAVTKPGEDDNELELRRSIARTAKKIAFETAPKIEVVKADWIVLGDVGAWNIFIDWQAFDHIPLQGHVSIADLARAVNAQESLVGRISAHLLATGKLLPGPAPNTLAHSRISPLYRSTSPVSTLCSVAVGNCMKPHAHWPEYFRAYGRREPAPDLHESQESQGRGQGHTPFSFAWGHPELPPWEVKALYPSYASAFAKSMKSRQVVGGDTPVVGPGALCDLSWVGVEAKKMGEGSAVVVDVGGGLGQLLKDVLRDVEGIRPGQCVLQDRKEVIEEARKGDRGALEGVVMMEHDFHEEQPVKGALVYFLRRILLDYSDPLAIQILRRLADALPADNPKARIIVMEERRLDVPRPDNTLVDMVMLNLGGKLRNEAKFEELASAAGLKVVGYYSRGQDPMSAVECARA